MCKPLKLLLEQKKTQFSTRQKLCELMRENDPWRGGEVSGKRVVVSRHSLVPRGTRCGNYFHIRNANKLFPTWVTKMWFSVASECQGNVSCSLIEIKRTKILYTVADSLREVNKFSERLTEKCVQKYNLSF